MDEIFGTHTCKRATYSYRLRVVAGSLSCDDARRAKEPPDNLAPVSASY
jgi:hypothetical protein